jgi:glutaminyl-peptide cyclotransferase
MQVLAARHTCGSRTVICARAAAGMVIGTLVSTVVTVGCTASPGAVGPDQPARQRAVVLAEVPHDTAAFTQGLELVDGVLYEGTGLEGSSSLRALDPTSGEVQTQVALPADLFGEGITAVGSTIWQVTWQDGVAIQRDRSTLAELRRVSYSGEGWGLCYDTAAGRLVMSDGTDRLTFRDPQTFQPVGETRVTSGGKPITRINELECVPGAVLANIWTTDTVVRIDLGSGRVTAEVDLSGLLPAKQRASVDVLNGIAAVPGTDQFLVTGKRWPKLFRVRFVPDVPY